MNPAALARHQTLKPRIEQQDVTSLSPSELDLAARTAYGGDPNANAGQGFQQYGNSVGSQISAPAPNAGNPAVVADAA